MRLPPLGPTRKAILFPCTTIFRTWNWDVRGFLRAKSSCRMSVFRRRPDGWGTFPALLPHAARKAGKQRLCNIGRGGHDTPHDQEGAQHNGKMGNGVAQANVDECNSRRARGAQQQPSDMPCAEQRLGCSAHPFLLLTSLRYSLSLAFRLL